MKLRKELSRRAIKKMAMSDSHDPPEISLSGYLG